MLIVVQHESGRITKLESHLPSNQWDMKFGHDLAEIILLDIRCDDGPHTSVAYWDGEVLYNSYKREEFHICSEPIIIVTAALDT